jgi:hypothetical protein
MDLEGIDNGLIEILPLHLAGDAGENHEMPKNISCICPKQK